MLQKAARAVTVVLLAGFGTLALMLVDTCTGEASFMLAFLRDTLAALSGARITMALLLIALLVLNARFAFRQYPYQKGERLRMTLLAAFFALVATFSAAARTDSVTVADLFQPYALILAIIKFVGFVALFYVGLKALLCLLPALAARLRSLAPNASVSSRAMFFRAWFIILCGWLPSFILRMPGAVTGDAGRVLQQFTGEIAMTADHPVTFTYLLGGLTQLGHWLGSDNLGLLLYTLLQWLALSAAMAMMAADLRTARFPTGFCYALAVFYALLPLAMMNAALVIKDIPYSAAFIGFTVCYARALLHPGEAFASSRWRISCALFTLALLLFRHNGVLTVLPCAAVLLARLWWGKPRIAVRWRLWVIGALLFPVAAVMLLNTYAVPRVAIKVDSTPDMLGVAIQQTARILRNDPSAATAQEMAIIDRVLDAENLAAAYQPRTSDPVRKLFRFHNQHTQADVQAFVGVWLKLVSRHPLEAVQAFWSLSSGFLDPFDPHQSYSVNMLATFSPKYPQALHIAHPQVLQPVRDRLGYVEEIYRGLPLLSLTHAIGLYSWGLLLGWFLIRRSGHRKDVWLLLPALMTLLGCLFSAGYLPGVRYALPLVYTAPYLLSLPARGIFGGGTSATPSTEGIAGDARKALPD